MSEEITQWEYTTANTNDIKKLNELGKEGWETTGNTTAVSGNLIMKRPLKKSTPSYDNGYSR